MCLEVMESCSISCFSHLTANVYGTNQMTLPIDLTFCEILHLIRYSVQSYQRIKLSGIDRISHFFAFSVFNGATRCHFASLDNHMLPQNRK